VSPIKRAFPGRDSKGIEKGREMEKEAIEKRVSESVSTMMHQGFN
jgi:hypothetical protein